jgi:hypothetical protein
MSAKKDVSSHSPRKFVGKGVRARGLAAQLHVLLWRALADRPVPEKE